MGLGTGPGLAAGLGGIVGVIVVGVGLVLAVIAWVTMTADANRRARDVKTMLADLGVPAPAEGVPEWAATIIRTILELAKTASGYALAIMLIGTLLIVGSAWGNGTGAATASPSPTPTATPTGLP